jgi:hypothetical protein
MAKEDNKPLQYQLRLRDTKGVAQRLDLSYLKRPALLALLRTRLIWVALAMAALACIPLVLGIGGSRRAVESARFPMLMRSLRSAARSVTHSAFHGVPDPACSECHDGGPHPAKWWTAGIPRRNPVRAVTWNTAGKAGQAAVASRNCTTCRRSRSSFHWHQGEERPPFGRNASSSPPRCLPDARPLRLNHAIHCPPNQNDPRHKAPECGDCHATDLNSPCAAL